MKYKISLNPPLPPQQVPDEIEVFGYHGGKIGVLKYNYLVGGHQGYCFYPNGTPLGGKNTLRQIADAVEQANRLRGTDY